MTVDYSGLDMGVSPINSILPKVALNKTTDLNEGIFSRLYWTLLMLPFEIVLKQFGTINSCFEETVGPSYFLSCKRGFSIK